MVSHTVLQAQSARRGEGTRARTRAAQQCARWRAARQARAPERALPWLEKPTPLGMLDSALLQSPTKETPHASYL